MAERERTRGSRIFISYSSAMRPLAAALHETLVKQRHAPRLDCIDNRSGDVWREKLAAWMSACEVAIVLLCDDAARSEWVRHEISVLSNRVSDPEDRLQLIVQRLGAQESTVEEYVDDGLALLQQIQLPPWVAPPRADDSPDVFSSVATGIAGYVSEPAISTPIRRLASQVNDDIAEATEYRIQSVVRAREVLSVQGDPWDGDRLEGPVSPDHKAEVRSRFAQELCLAPLDSYFPPLNELPQEVDFGTLIDRGIQAGVDAEYLDWLAYGQGAAVAPVAQALIASLSIEAAHIMRRMMRPVTFTANLRLTTDDPEEWADALVDELNYFPADHFKSRTFNAVHDIALRRRMPLFVIIAHSEGLYSDHVDAAEARISQARLVLLPAEGEPPTKVARRVNRPLAGHARDMGLWKTFAAAERRMLMLSASLRSDLSSWSEQ